MRGLRIGALGIAVAALAGCEEYSVNNKALEASADFDSGDESADTASTDSAPVPGWFAISATLSVELGAAGAGVGTVRVDVVDTSGSAVLCGADLSAGWEGVEGEAAAALWWTLTVDGADLCAALPELRLGIGALLPDARARLGAVGVPTGAAVYGAYVDVGVGADIFGYAARPEDLAGEGEAVLPPPDGQYALEPLYLIPL